MFKKFSMKKNTTTEIDILNDKANNIFFSLLFLLSSFIFMVLPPLALYFISKYYNFSNGIKDGLYWLIVAFISWIDFFVVSLIEHKPFGGFTICGVMMGLISLINVVHNFTILYNYV